jgi:vanillate O-demethylase monooxygenase subunit
MHQQLMAAFHEDIVGLEAMEELLSNMSPEDEFFEISVKSDIASVAMRRYLKRRAEAERSQHSAPEAVQSQPAINTAVEV